MGQWDGSRWWYRKLTHGCKLCPPRVYPSGREVEGTRFETIEELREHKATKHAKGAT
jgi:hypothetical protein